MRSMSAVRLSVFGIRPLFLFYTNYSKYGLLNTHSLWEMEFQQPAVKAARGHIPIPARMRSVSAVRL